MERGRAETCRGIFRRQHARLNSQIKRHARQRQQPGIRRARPRNQRGTKRLRNLDVRAVARIALGIRIRADPLGRIAVIVIAARIMHRMTVVHCNRSRAAATIFGTEIDAN